MSAQTRVRPPCPLPSLKASRHDIDDVVDDDADDEWCEGIADGLFGRIGVNEVMSREWQLPLPNTASGLARHVDHVLEDYWRAQ